ncbi:MAG: zinc ribbon domain-containing protein [Promethearchaeota archaeon]|nr:MAG: zinc ribbon domain-containing protein [Candidatus Lokiarchaeota archaeon]
MAKFCPYCGNPVKQTDKYCIICGKPMLTDISKTEKKSDRKESKIREEIRDEGKIEEAEELKEEKKEEILDIELKVEKKSKKSKEKREIKSLPEDVKEQMVYYIEYNDIQLNKKVLSDRLNEISKSTKDPRYEYDIAFKKEITIKLEAIKTLIGELKQKESVIKQNLEEPFIVQRITNDIDTKIFQLENLAREHKLHKVDRESFEKLRDKYKQEKLDLENQRDDLTEGMKLWIQDLKLEKAELSGDRKLNKGRFHAKEISEEEFKANDKDFDLKLKKIKIKIETLEKLTK